MKQLSFLLFFTIFFSSIGQNHPGKVKWYTIDEATKLQKENPKPIFVDIYTDWCGWCKKLDATTFNDDNISSYLNNYYYPVKLDAESADTMMYYGEAFVHPTGTKRTRTYHPLAQKLLGGKSAFPTMTFITPDQKIMPVSSYMDAKKIQPLLVWVAEQASDFTPYAEFSDAFNKYFYKEDTVPYVDVNWLSLKQAQELQKTKPKKILLFLEADWVFSARMMNRTFGQKEVADYLNETYYCVKINATEKNDIEGFGQVWKNESEQTSIHPLVAALSDNKLKFPGLIWLNEEGKLINRVQSYVDPVLFQKMLTFFGSNDYLTIQWKDYQAQ